ncbi:hypothetical protein NC652_003346 [Populus alba x Populus x berolinensis]|nr:hypothetical protein NC652_003346 [Populus alba x Populus x berolinensis]
MEKKNAFAPEIHHGHAPRFYLKVNIQCCSACPRRAKETLEKFSGVLAITIDTEQGLVAVTGTIDPQIVIQKFARWGKKAVLCSPEKDPVNGDSSGCSCCDDDSDSECDCDRNYDEEVSKSQNIGCRSQAASWCSSSFQAQQRAGSRQCVFSRNVCYALRSLKTTVPTMVGEATVWKSNPWTNCVRKSSYATISTLYSTKVSTTSTSATWFFSVKTSTTVPLFQI